MSEYTEAASRFGQYQGGADDRALFLTEFGGMVISAYDEAMDYMDLRIIKNITQGKSDTFPVIGRKRDAAEHEAGELILGGSIQSGEVEITLDKMVYDSVFIAEIDELISHFEVRGPYAHQLGQSLGSLQSKRVARMHILASRWVADGNDLQPGQPTPSYAYDANMKTSATAIENAAFSGQQFLMENEISGYRPLLKLPVAQYLLVARNFGVEDFKAEAGGGDRRAARVNGQMAGFDLGWTNHMPLTNITTGNTKYQGDFSTTVGHISSKVAVGSLERRGMRVVMKDQEERLGTIIIASQFNGHGVLRPEASFELATTVRS